MSYFAADPAWWRGIRERLPKPFAREDALMDLRWWQDQVLVGAVRRMPTFRVLAEEWGWGEKRARLLMSDEEAWSDPAKAERWRAQTGHRQGTPRAHRGHTEGTNDKPADNASAPERAQSGHTEGATGAQSGHKKGDTRRDPQTPTPTHTPTPAAATRAREPDPLVIARLLALQQEQEPQHGLAEDRDRNACRRALMQGVPEQRLTTLWAWSGESPDGEAEACRRNDWRRWASLLRHPLGTQRLQAADAWDRAGRPRAPPRQPRRDGSTAGDGVLEEARRRLREVHGGNDGRGDGVLAGDRGSRDPPALGDGRGVDPVGAGVGGRAR